MCVCYDSVGTENKSVATDVQPGFRSIVPFSISECATLRAMKIRPFQ